MNVLNRRNFEEIGMEIKRIRKEKGYSQNEIAELSALNQSEISMIEKGKYRDEIEAVILLKLVKRLKTKETRIIIPVDLAVEIKFRRTENMITLNDLAFILDLSISTLSLLENGKGNLATLKLINKTKLIDLNDIIDKVEKGDYK